MMIGQSQSLTVRRDSLHGFYLGDEEAEVLLPRGQTPPGASPGDELRVFVYTDSDDRPIATTKIPLAEVGEFAFLEVVAVTQAGAFLAWGLDKDLFCPQREQKQPMRVGEHWVVAVYFDEVSERVACSSRVSQFLQPSGTRLQVGQKVQVQIFGLGRNWMDVIVDGAIKGAIFPDEKTNDLRLGDRREAYVKQIRASDGRVAISLRPQGHRAVYNCGEQILCAMREAGGTLQVSDKSSPEEIQRLFGLSKGAFKKLLGNLYREGRITIETDRITLRDN